jgi:hypothetical protein
MSNKVMIRRIPAAMLGMSEPNPSWFGNSPNEPNNPNWSSKNCESCLPSPYPIVWSSLILSRVEKSIPFLLRRVFES